jgi:ABC-2 type transport system permease protein
MRAPLLTRPMFLGLRNSLTAGAILRRLPFAVIGVLFWFGLYLATYILLSFIRDIEFIGEIFAEKLFSMTFFSLTGFLVLSNVITSISSFYLSRDLPFLFSKPVPTGDIVGFKTLETGLQSTWMVITFLAPVFIAYGVHYGAPPLYYLVASLAILLFLALTTGAGILIGHLLTAIFPARRSRDVMIGAITLLFLTFYFIIKSALPQDLSAPDAVIRSFARFSPDSPFLPDYWITRTLFPLLKGGLPDFLYGLVLFSNACFFLLLSSTFGKMVYRRNIEKILPAERTPGKGLLRGIYPSVDSAFLYKDGITFFRDTGQWSQIFVILALVAVYLYNFRSIPLDAMLGLSPFAAEIMVAINVLMAGLVLSAVAARFLYTSVSLEGRAFWVVKTSPVNVRRLLWLKFLSGCPPVALLIVSLVVLTNYAMHVKGTLMVISALTGLLMSVTICGLATGLGAAYPKFRYDNIAAVSVSIGAVVFMIIAFGLVVATIAIESWIFYLHVIRPEGLPVVQVVLLLIALFGMHATAFYLPIKIGAGRLGEDADNLGL